MSPERPPKVFISYSHDSDEHMERVLSLADRLRSSGVDAMIDQYVHDPEDGWQAWTESQMRNADLVLVVCTETYLKRAERREEPGIGHGAIWEIAVGYDFLYDQGMKNKKLVPVVFDKADLAYIPKPLKPYTNYCVANDKGYLELYRRLTNQPFITMPELGRIESLPRREKATQTSARSKPSRFWNVPHARNDAFTGREQLLTDLRSDLLKKGKQALFGLGGVGKTQIAVEYAYRHQDEYTAVFWCFAGTEQSVRSGYAAIATLLNLLEKDSQEQAKVTDAVKRWLEQNTGWLLVLDNADDPSMVKPFLPQDSTGHILLTSRAYSFQKIGLVSPREVNVLSPHEAREFLLRRTRKEPTEKSPDADALAKELGYLPLALEQAAAYIGETGASFSSYLAGYRKQRLRLLEKQGPVIGNDEKEQQKRTVATTWALNFADIERNFPASADLLRLSAFLAPDAIPLELLENGAEELPEELAAKVSESADNPLVLDELLSPLLRYSLVRRDDEKRTYSIHPLVQEVVRDGLSEEDQKAWAEQAVRTVNAAFPNPEFENWTACDRLLPHVIGCSDFINSMSLEFAEAAQLLNRAGYYLDDRAEYVLAEPLYQRALTIREKLFGPEHYYTSISLNNLALLFENQGRYQEAESLLKRVLQIREKEFGLQHSATATSLNNLGNLYRTQNRNEEAEPLFLRSLAICEKQLGPEHRHTASSLNNLGMVYHAQGQYQKAEPMYLRALAIDEKTLGTNHPDTAIDLHNLALLYWRQGRHNQAETLFHQALETYERTIGPDHPRTVQCHNALIQFYRDQGRNAEADALEKAAQGKAK